jgi:hypothetical protein
MRNASMPTTIEKSSALDTTSSPSKAARFNMMLSQATYEELKDVASEAGMDMSEFVRTAIRLFLYIQREKAKGKSLYIGEDDKPEKEIVIP